MGGLFSDLNLLGSDRLLIRSPNWLGDAIMTLPAIHRILQARAKKGSESPSKETKQTGVYILTPPKIADLWKMIAGIDGILETRSSLSETVKEIRSFRPNSALILPNSWRTALEMALARVPARIGYHGHFGRKMILTHTWPKPKTATRHQALDYLDLVQYAGIETTPSIELPSLNELKPSPIQEPYIALCPGAEYGPAKRWPSERFSQSAQMLAQEYGWKILLLGARGDQPVATEIEKTLSPEICINLTGKTNLNEFIRSLADAKLVLCNDSGSMHLASLLRKPAVAIFGSTEPALTGPLHEAVQVLRHKVECSPCFLRECPIDMRCMTRISVTQVIDAAHKTLNSNARE